MDKKLSELPAASALTGAELVHVVQSGVNRKTTVALLSASTLEWTTITANHTAVSGDRLLCDTSGGAFTVTLPPSPSTGAWVEIADAGDFAADNLTVARNGQTINDSPADLTVNTAGLRLTLIFTGSTWSL